MIWNFYREVSESNPDDVLGGHLVRKGDSPPTPEPGYKLEFITTLSAPTRRGAMEYIEREMCGSCCRFKSKCREEQLAAAGIDPKDMDALEAEIRQGLNELAPKFKLQMERMKAVLEGRRVDTSPPPAGPKVDHKTGKPLEPVKPMTVEEVERMYEALAQRGTAKPEA